MSLQVFSRKPEYRTDTEFDLMMAPDDEVITIQCVIQI